MARIVFIGAETTAAGFRLAGLEARIATPDDAAETLRQALAEQPDCVLLDGTLIDAIPATLFESALAAEPTLFAVVPDVRGHGAPPDLAQQVRNALGLDT